MAGSKNSSGGPKESDNGDKSLRGLIIALAVVGTIAGSVILLAYASSESPAPDEAASIVDEVALQPEEMPVIVEEIVDELAFTEKIEYINSTAEVKEEPSGVNNTTAEVEKEIPRAEQEQPAYDVNNTNDISGNLTGNDPDSEEESSDDLPSSDQSAEDNSQAPPTEPNEQENEDQDSSDETDKRELQDILPKRVLDLLDRVIDVDDDDKNKGKDRKGNN
ncbi:MAG: hypothetical protein QXX64_05935 [Nitrososphaera sp.]|uniref:Uncharacterized protein n=1 Tax=Nitrososphaera gargensis (strain Ga9.2) TaxID=1237085 RepID=K0IET2_NITGG|nr:hypothetical protein [Candidatus Nitrososphaera gargensis]AFU58270.1 hypothetical protein Ngar_c13320 [Candidatus Nitrososphaera gargensis Ga9.2]